MADLTFDEIRDRFTYHPPSPDGVERHARLSDLFCNIAAAIQEIVPDGRERALVMTKLEEAKMWASAGVARNPETR